jgi:hypothetical protein
MRSLGRKSLYLFLLFGLAIAGCDETQHDIVDSGGHPDAFSDGPIHIVDSAAGEDASTESDAPVVDKDLASTPDTIDSAVGEDAQIDAVTQKDAVTDINPDTAISFVLHSVTIASNNVTVVYSKGFSTCAHLYKVGGGITHTKNFFCPNGTMVSVTQPLTEFSGLSVGDQVHLKHGNSNIFSNVVTVQ